ncbi:hypothetical protein L5515_006813 [Caenorhabditis briggsae]|uniref:SCP domain-containing protein n=1 Tax=Caenorhabditis briggsae TaxID=6238 RepID=A0AAE9EWU4_CAEBR|nr:hypothetical protein L5515_006813 [Caenorhabditis briggsae]
MKFFALFILVILGCTSAKFTAVGIKHILRAHNDLRSDIALGVYDAAGSIKPPATNMRKMTWDSSLATSAQAFAETCPTNHSNADGLGENIFFSYSATDKNSLDYYGARASQLWEEEFQQYGWDSTTMDDNASNIKDATQMAWAETGLIGCGVKVCGKDKSGASQFKYVVVCHYKKPGNKIGAEIYQPGDTCTACSAGLTCETASGLCA